MKTIQKAFNRISSIAEEAAKYEFSNQFATLRSELMKAFSFIEPKKARGIGALNAPVREIERLMQDLKSASLSEVESIVSQVKNKKIEVEQSLKTIEDDIDTIDRMTNSIKQELKPLEALAIEMGGKPQQVPLWKQSPAGHRILKNDLPTHIYNLHTLLPQRNLLWLSTHLNC